MTYTTGVLTDDGLMDRWYEYVPASYDGSRKVPLVVGIHGGLMTGWGHAIYTSWTMLADREGFICVFPGRSRQNVTVIPAELCGHQVARGHALHKDPALSFYWMHLNECDPLPQIQIVGEHNLAFYTGKKCDVVYHDIKNRDHGQTRYIRPGPWFRRLTRDI